MMWAGLFILIILVSAYLRLPLLVWSLLLTVGFVAFSIFSDATLTQKTLLWILFAAVVIPLNVKPVRLTLLSRAIRSEERRVGKEC